VRDAAGESQEEDTLSESREEHWTVLLLGLTGSILGGGVGCANAMGKLVLALGPWKWSAVAS
jgi:hypothetical protein